MEYAVSQLFSKKSKDPDTQDPHVAAVAQGHRDHGRYAPMISVCLGFCYGGEQKDCDGVGDGRGKKDERKGHAGEDAIYRKSLRIC